MVRVFILTVAIGLSASPLGAAAEQSEPRTMTGWFADKQCASPNAAKGVFEPNNPDCVKECLAKGIPPVFISDQAKALFEVRDYPSVKDDVGYYVELTGTVGDAGKTISVTSVKRLSYAGAMCLLPPKKGPGQK